MAAESPDMSFMEFSRRGEEYGQNGVSTEVITNAYSVGTPSKKCELDFVDVNIIQKNAPAETRIRKDQNRLLILKAMQNLQSQWQMTQRPLFAYDDEKTLVFVNTAVPLGKGEASTVKVTEPGRGADGLPTQIEYAITLKITKTLLISDADFRPIHPKTPDEERMRQTRRSIECLQALNLLLREALTDPATRNADRPDIMVVSLQDKIFSNVQEAFFRDDRTQYRSIWQGFTAALGISKNGLVLKADLTHSVFFRECLLSEVIGQMLGIWPLSANSQVDPKLALKAGLSSTLKSRLVSFKTADGEVHNSGVITKVQYRPAGEQYMSDADQTPVLQAYEQHNQQLLFPKLGCIEITESGYTYKVPYEKVNMKNGQRYNKMLNKSEQAVFIRAVSLSPDRRIGAIAKFMELSNVRQHPLLQAIGLRIDSGFLNIKARILPQPELEYGGTEGQGPRSVQPSNGQWNMPLGARYQNAAQAPRADVTVVVIYPRRQGQPCVPEGKAREFVELLRREGRNRGMRWDGPLKVYEMPLANDWRSAEKFMGDRLVDDVIQKMNPAFIFGIFDRNADRMYSDFKSILDHECGIPSQGLLCDTVDRNPRGAIENIMYKVNVKFGGNNNVLADSTLQSLKLLHRLFMVVGISLSHGKTKDDKAKTSYAGFVGSIDDSFHRWTTETMAVGSNDAILPDNDVRYADVSERMMSLLKTYKENVGRFPEVLVVYRDGVTRTHENELHRHDIKCIREAFQRLEIKVELVFIVVNKMHRTRFFRQPNRNTMGELGYSRDNIPPGLLVDDVVVDPFGDDFYLASHRGLLGTSRPIRYHILVNEDTTAFPDDIQGLTMSLCYTYQRCNMGVSIPAPLYYANLAAARCAVLADSIVRSNPAPPVTRAGFRGGRGGGRGGGPRGGDRGVPMDECLLRQVERGIQQHPNLLKRLNYI